MSGDYLKEFINTVTFLLPVLILVWKGAKLSAQVEQLDETVKEKVKKFCDEHRELEQRIEQERKDTYHDINEVLNTLNEIRRSIVRIETTLNIDDRK